MDYIGLDAPLLQPSREPETVATRFEGESDPIDPLLLPLRFTTPTTNQV